MGVKKKFKTKAYKDPQPNLGIINDGTQATATDGSQAETVEETVTQNETELLDASQDEKRKKSNKPRKDLMEIIADRLGYVKLDKVTLWTTGIFKIIEGMDEKDFAALPLKEKFEALTDGIAKLMNAHALELERANTALDEAKGRAETEAQTKVEAANSLAVQAERRAADAKEKVTAVESEKQQLLDKISEMDTAKHEQDQRDKKELDSINALKQKNDELLKKNSACEEQLKATKDSNTQLWETNKELDKKFNKLQTEHTDLKTEHSKLQTDYKGLQTNYANLQNDYTSLLENYNTCKARREELEASEVGQLTETISAKDEEINRLNADKTAVEEAKKQIEDAKNLVDKQLEDANWIINTRNEELKIERETTKGLRSTIKAHEGEIDALTKQNGEFAEKMENQTTELEARRATINEKVEEIGRLNHDNDSLRGEITALNKTINGLEHDKATLIAANETAEQQLGEKADFIRAERDDFSQKMMSLAKGLSEAAAKDFLGCCDDAFESNRISLQEKVLKPTRALEREMAEINPDSYASRDELAVAYHSLIKSQLDEASGLTRIAQWYAYSQVAFMVDKDRSDGLFIWQREIRDIYRLAVRLMGNVGIEYCLPALYAEHLSEDSSYDDVTGRRQLNIEYMCPTARNHKENIDCIDNAQVIIDVVEVGYTDDKGNNKKSQVII